MRVFVLNKAETGLLRRVKTRMHDCKKYGGKITTTIRFL